MSDQHKIGHHALLQQIAHKAMLERGLLPDFQAPELAELAAIHEAEKANDMTIRDLRNLAWCSIDNNDSRDLDQLTYADEMGNGNTKILVAVADVDSLVPKNSALDAHAAHNTSTVYTAAEVFPMLPEKLSTDLTSLNLDSDRLAMVVEMLIAEDGTVSGSDIYRALVRNKARLSYNSVADWLEDKDSIPQEISAVRGLEANLRLQDKAAQKMKLLRHEHGALEFETIHPNAVFENEALRRLDEDRSNRAKDIIADFMIGVNAVVAGFLAKKKFASIRRIVRIPKRWDRIVQLAAERGSRLPAEPDSKALNQFLIAEKVSDPVRFPDLSLSVIKLLGGGEYAVELPGGTSTGHFGLAVKDYTHSTAPNRRYSDLITQRLLKAAISSKPTPYTDKELQELARHCTLAEDSVKKVERLVEKSAAALLLEHRIGEQFEGIVTGSSPKGTWVRLLSLPVEGRLEDGVEGIDVGDKIRVKLVHTDAERGFIDFRKI